MCKSRRLALYATLFTMLGVLLAACSSDAGMVPPTPEPSATPVPPTAVASSPTAATTPGTIIKARGIAQIDSVSAAVLKTTPIQVQVKVAGNLPDACTELDPATQVRQGNTIVVTIATSRPGNLMCAQVLKPFEDTISLETAGLAPGTYTVAVNGTSAQFQLP